MVDFTKTIQADEQQGSDQRGGYRTPDKTFWGDALGTAAKGVALYQEAEVADQTSKAEASIRAAADKTYFASGINEELVAQGVPRGDIERFQRLHKASVLQGGNRAKLAVAQYNSLVRDLRNKFPKAPIDKLIKEVTGINPKEEALKYAQKDFESAQQELTDWDKRWQDIKDPAVAAAYQIYGQGGTPDIALKNEIEHFISSRQAELTAIEQQDKDTVRTARRWAGAASNDIFLEAGLMFRAYGKDGVQSMLNNPQSYDGLVKGVATLKTRFAGFVQTLNEKYPELDPAERDKIIKNTKETLDAFTKAVNDKDINMMNASMMSATWQANEDAARWVRNNPQLSSAAVIADKFKVPFVVEQLITDKMTKDGTSYDDIFAVEVSANVVGNPEYRVPSLRELAIQANQNSSSTNPETVMTKTIKNVAEFITDANSDPVRVQEIAEAWLTKGQLSEAAKVFDKSPIEVVTYLTQPAIMQAIAKKTPEGTRGAVLKGLVDYMKEPDMQRLGNNLSHNIKPWILGQGATLAEGKDGTLMLVNAAGQKIEQNYSTSRWMGSAYIDLAKVNKVIKNLKTAHEIMGQDWDDVKGNVFFGMNMNVKTQEDVSNPQDIQSEFKIDQDLAVMQTKNETMLKGPAAAIAAPLYKFEGTNTKDGYDALLAHSQRDQFKDIKPTQMTIKELQDFAKGEYGMWSKEKKRQLGRKDANLASTPVGKYQILAGSTLGELAAQLDIPEDTLFTPEVQDRMFLALLERRGWNKFLNREISPSKMAKELISEWEGFGKYGQLLDRLQEIQQQASMT